MSRILRYLAAFSRESKSRVESITQEKPLDSRLSTLDLQGESLLITVGGTREAIDPVRFISNHRRGKWALRWRKRRLIEARKLRLSAASRPPSRLEMSNNSRLFRRRNAPRRDELENATVFIGAAAVADYRPKKHCRNENQKTNQDFLTWNL